MTAGGSLAAAGTKGGGGCATGGGGGGCDDGTAVEVDEDGTGDATVPTAGANGAAPAALVAPGGTANWG